MKILIPILGFGKGGGNRVLSELSNYWISLGHEVSFICLSESTLPYFPTTAKIYWVDKSGKIIDSNIKDQKRSFLNVISQCRRLTRAMNEVTGKFDVVLANQALTSWSVYLSKNKAQKYYYIQAYEAGYNFYQFSIKNILVGLMAYLTYKLPLIRIVNSPIYFKYSNIRSSYYIPPGLDFSKFYPVETGSSNNSLVIGCVGRLEKFKGTLDVYNAFKILVAKQADVSLYVAYGDINNYEEEYRDKIRIFTPKNDAELGQFYRSLDILIAPGTVQFYAHHYPVMEAMASKVPVITTGYLPADRSNSWIVGPYSPEQIAESVLFIRDHQEVVKHKTELAYNNIQYYKWTTIAQDFLRIFEDNNITANEI